MTTNVTAPLNSPTAAGARPPVSTASGNSSNASAATSVPLANANSTPVTRSGAAHDAPAIAPSTNALEPIKPMISASPTVDLYPVTAGTNEAGGDRERPSRRDSGTPRAFDKMSSNNGDAPCEHVRQRRLGARCRGRPKTSQGLWRCRCRSQHTSGQLGSCRRSPVSFADGEHPDRAGDGGALA